MGSAADRVLSGQKTPLKTRDWGVFVYKTVTVWRICMGLERERFT